MEIFMHENIIYCRFKVIFRSLYFMIFAFNSNKSAFCVKTSIKPHQSCPGRQEQKQQGFSRPPGQNRIHRFPLVYE